MSTNSFEARKAARDARRLAKSSTQGEVHSNGTVPFKDNGVRTNMFNSLNLSRFGWRRVLNISATKTQEQTLSPDEIRAINAANAAKNSASQPKSSSSM